MCYIKHFSVGFYKSIRLYPVVTVTHFPQFFEPGVYGQRSSI